MRLTSPLRGLAKIRLQRGIPFIIALATTLNLGQWVFTAWRVRPQPDPIPLHYTTTFGIDRIGPWYLAYLLPLSGTVMLLINTMLYASVVEHQRASAVLITVLTTFLELMLLAAAVLTFRLLA
ncbi:MAG: hypothetical protein HY567_02755 [Candidatus Kerfeldbacteria bacterium]|nr:hypothetical protein [Candidatus Kerfeldbacteria bacterium]